MGKKVSPISIRVGITRAWDSNWFSSFKDFGQNIVEDYQIRKYFRELLKQAALSKIEIKRMSSRTSVILHSAKAGFIIGRSGENIANLVKELEKRFRGKFDVSVQEIRKPDSDASLIAQSIASQIEKRFPYRRVCKMALDKAKESGLRGLKVKVAGRLNGVDIARSETYTHGTVPLHTLRANIDYATARAHTTYGIIGIKVWTYSGLVFKNKNLTE